MADITEYFETFTDLCSKVYWLLYESAPQIVHWFITPINETMGDSVIAEIIGEFSPIELTFGGGVILALTMGLVKFFISLVP